jgi:beta-N-acetylhexosaminidase
VQGELRDGLGFTGAVFSDDLSMAGAAGAGTVPERARQALAAGCDVLAICNDRSGVLATLEELADESDPLSQVRLVRLHGRPAALSREALATLPRWQECRDAVDHCRDAPQLRLDA